MLGDIGERESRENGDIRQRSPHLPIKTVYVYILKIKAYHYTYFIYV